MTTSHLDAKMVDTYVSFLKNWSMEAKLDLIAVLKTLTNEFTTYQK